MAVVLEFRRLRSGDWWAEGSLLEDAAANTDGIWVPVEGVAPFTVEVSGITTAEVSIHASNAATKPADSAHGTDLTEGQHLTADGMFRFNDATVVKWIKARIQGYAAGTINARLVGVLA